jgi:hypothetical protein
MTSSSPSARPERLSRWRREDSRVLTGASGGIGSAPMRKLRAHGAKVVGLDHLAVPFATAYRMSKRGLVA